MSEQEYCIKHDYFFHGDPDDCPLCEVDDLKEEITRLREQLAEAEGQEPVAFTCHGNSAPAYSCNKPGDMSGMYYRNPAPAKVPGESELVHIGYTNGAQVLYCVANKSGSFYPDTENDSCIPVYMLRTHAHRLESTTNGEVTLDRIKREWAMLKSQGGE